MLLLLLNSSVSSPGEDVVLFFFFSLFLGTLTRHLSKEYKLRIPYTVLLLLLGLMWGTVQFAIKGNIGRLGSAIETLVRINPQLMFLLFLPALIFESAFSVNPHIMQREIGQALLLAVPGLLIASGMTACVAFYMFDYNWSWDVCILFGAILSATDPVAVVALLRELGSSKRLATLIEAESLLNDGSSVVIYIIMLDRVRGEFKPSFEVMLLFFRLTVGGLVLGVTLGMLAVSWLRRVYRDSLVETSITIITAYLAFWTAESLGLEVSGVLTCVFLGLYLANFKTEVSPDVEQAMHHVWHMISYVANTLLFLLSGAIVAYKLLQDHFRAIDFVYLGLLYLSLHIIRLVMVLMLAPLIRKLGYGLNWADGLILVFGGLRGAIALALALKTDLLEDVDDATSDRILFHVSGIVLLTLVINASTMRYVLRALGRDSASMKPSGMVFRKAAAYVECQTTSLLASLAHDRYFRGADLGRIRLQLPAFVEGIDKMANNEKDTILDMPLNSAQVALERVRTLSIAPVMKPVTSGTAALAPIRTNSMMGSCSLGYTEFRHVMLLAMRAAINELFEEGMVSANATRLLVESCEQGLDEDDFSEQWAVIEPLLTLPRWLERAYRLEALRPLLRGLVIKRLTLAVEIVAAYVRAAQNASQHIIETLDEICQNTTFLYSKAQLDYFIAQASHKWLTIQVRYRDLHRMIQARHLAEFVLIREKELVKSLYGKGILEEAEHQQMDAMVEQRLRQINRSLALGHGIAVTAHDKFKTADLMCLIPHAAREIFFNESEPCVLEQGEKLFTSFEECRSVYVITHGVLLLEHPGLADESIASGTVLGLFEALTGGRYLATAVAASDVEVRLIDLSLLKRVMRMTGVGDLIWEFTARQLALLSFFRPFLPSSSVTASNLVQSSSLVEPTSNAVVDLQTPAFLITGKAYFELRRPQKDAGPVGEAPCLLMPSFRMYRFSENTRLLQFPSRWDLPYADVVLRSPSYDELISISLADRTNKLQRSRSLALPCRSPNICPTTSSSSSSSINTIELTRSATLYPQFMLPKMQPKTASDRFRMNHSISEGTSSLTKVIVPGMAMNTLLKNQSMRSCPHEQRMRRLSSPPAITAIRPLIASPSTSHMFWSDRSDGETVDDKKGTVVNPLILGSHSPHSKPSLCQTSTNNSELNSQVPASLHLNGDLRQSFEGV